MKEHLSKSELERFNSLENVTSDIGKGNSGCVSYKQKCRECVWVVPLLYS